VCSSAAGRQFKDLKNGENESQLLACPFYFGGEKGLHNL
jgi:hypothetical protein